MHHGFPVVEDLEHPWTLFTREPGGPRFCLREVARQDARGNSEEVMQSMNGGGESDRVVVPGKLAEQRGGPERRFEPAEAVEGRTLAKEYSHQAMYAD